MKKTKVELYAPSLKETREFDPEHAEKLLGFSTRWTLPKDSEYTYTKKDGLRKKRGKGTDQSAGPEAATE